MPNKGTPQRRMLATTLKLFRRDQRLAKEKTNLFLLSPRKELILRKRISLQSVGNLELARILAKRSPQTEKIIARWATERSKTKEEAIKLLQQKANNISGYIYANEEKKQLQRILKLQPTEIENLHYNITNGINLINGINHSLILMAIKELKA